MIGRGRRRRRSKRIALIPSSYAPNLGGVEEHSRRLAIDLLARGYQVEVWTIHAPQLARTEIIDGIRVRRLPAPLPAMSPRDILLFLLRVPPTALRWSAAFASFRPGVLHVHCFGPNGTYADLLSTVTRRPLVLSLHGETFMDDYDIFEESRLAAGSLRRCLRRAAAVTGCSQLTLDDAVNRFGLAQQRGVVVFNGVDLDEQSSSGDEVARWALSTRPYVLAMGRLVRNKGFDLLITAFAELATELPDLALVIAGEGAQRAALTQQIETLGLTERVTLPGRASRATVAHAMQQATAFVMPSRVEPFGIVILEAWRAGAPVICSNRGGAAEFVEDRLSGVLVDPTHPTELATAIRSVVHNATFAYQLRTAGSIRVRDFGIGAATEKYADLYRPLLATPKSRKNLGLH